MSSLFRRLESYRPRPERDSKEDFFTEALCYVLEKNPEVLKAYIKFLWGDGFPDGEILDVEVDTQVMLGEKRPDVMIRFWINGLTYFIICEHKIGSDEGYKQLEIYKNDLAILEKDPNRRRLFYITQYSAEDLSTEPDRKFRWNDIYQELDRLEGNKLVDEKYKEIYKELLAYMCETEMAKSNKFSALEIASLVSVPKLVNLMDLCLDGIAWDILLELGVTHNVDNLGWQLTAYNRWSYFRFLWKIGNDELTVNMGLLLDYNKFHSDYGFKNGDIDYPELAVWLESRSRGVNRNVLEKYGLGVVEKLNSWDFVGRKNANSIAIVHKSLKEFIKLDENQIDEIRKWFKVHMQEIKGYVDKHSVKEFLETNKAETQK